MTGTTTNVGDVIVQGNTSTYNLLLANNQNITTPDDSNGVIKYEVGFSVLPAGTGSTYSKLGEVFDAGLDVVSQVYGSVYCLSGNSSSGATWIQADASSASTATGLLGVGIWDGNTEKSLLLRGFINVDIGGFSGTDVPGAPLYLSTVAGRYSFDPPTNTGEIVRIVGYFIQVIKDTNLYSIYFNPSNDWIEL